MPVSLVTKAQLAQKQEQKTFADLDTLTELAERLGEVQDELDRLSKTKTMRKVSELGKQLTETKQKLCAELALDGFEDEEFEFGGERYFAEVGPQHKKRTLNDDANLTLREMMGEETFLKLASIKLGDIDKYLTPEEQAKIITEARTPTRSIKVTKRA